MLPHGELMKIAVAQIGARHHYAIPTVFHRAGILEGLYTDLCASVGPLSLVRSFLPTALQPQALRRALGRTVDHVPPEKIHVFTGYALRRLMHRQRAVTPGMLRRAHVRANSEFCRLVVRRGLGNATAVYLFNGAALEIARYAKDKGITTIVEQTSAPVAMEERLLLEERERWPGWERHNVGHADWEPMAERESLEWWLADRILCGSQHVLQGIRAQGGPSDRALVVPYSAQAGFFRPRPSRRDNEPLHVLFVGTVSLQKGVQYLGEAARHLRSKEILIRVVGPIRVTHEGAAELQEALHLAGPVPRPDMAREYDWADVFVLPSICEGSATVCYEAMASGLPVITTPNAGSLVRDGVDGFIVPIRDAEALADKIMAVATDRELLRTMSDNAAQHARDFTWDRYAERLIAAVAGGS